MDLGSCTGDHATKCTSNADCVSNGVCGGNYDDDANTLYSSPTTYPAASGVVIAGPMDFLHNEIEVTTGYDNDAWRHYIGQWRWQTTGLLPTNATVCAASIKDYLADVHPYYDANEPFRCGWYSGQFLVVSPTAPTADAMSGTVIPASADQTTQTLSLDGFGGINASDWTQLRCWMPLFAPTPNITPVGPGTPTPVPNDAGAHHNTTRLSSWDDSTHPGNQLQIQYVVTGTPTWAPTPGVTPSPTAQATGCCNIVGGGCVAEGVTQEYCIALAYIFNTTIAGWRQSEVCAGGCIAPIGGYVPQVPPMVNVSIAGSTGTVVSTPNLACLIWGALTPTGSGEITVSDAGGNVVMAAKSKPAFGYFGKYGGCFESPLTFTGTGRGVIGWYARGRH